MNQTDKTDQEYAISQDLSNWSQEEQYTFLEVFKVLVEVDSQLHPEDYRSN